MKKIFLIATFILILTMAFSTVQVYATTDAAGRTNHGGPNQSNPGQSDRKATQQAEKDQRMTGLATAKAERMGEKLAGKKVHFRGVVKAVDAAALTVTLSTGEDLVFAINENTQFKIPTLGPDATWEMLNVGVTVLVQAVNPGETPEVNATVTDTATVEPTVEATATAAPVMSGLTAVKVLVVPGKPARIHRVGEVTAYEAGKTITIMARDGQEYTFALTENTKILPDDQVDMLKVGAVVTLISPRDVTGGPLTAQGIVIHVPDEENEDSETEVETPAP